jgi:hypothetical protein
MIVHTVITNWVLGALAKWYRSGLNPKALRDPRTGDLILRYTPRYRVAQSVISAFLGSIFVIGFLVYDIPSKLHPIKAGILTIGWAAIVGLIIVHLLQTFGSEWTIFHSGIRASVYGLIRKEIFWSEVSNVYLEKTSQELVFVTTQGKALKLALWIDGVADVALLLKSGTFPFSNAVVDELSEYVGIQAA